MKRISFPALLALAALLPATVPVTQATTPRGEAAALPPGALARLGTRTMRHLGPVTALHFVADDRQLLSAGSDRVIHAWDPLRGELLDTFAIEGDSILHLGSNGDDSQIVAVAADGRVSRVLRDGRDARDARGAPQVVDLASQFPTPSLGLDMFCAHHSEGENLALVDGEGTLRRLVTSKGMKVLGKAFSPGGTRLAISSYEIPEGASKHDKVAIVRIVDVNAATGEDEIRSISVPGGFQFSRLGFVDENTIVTAGTDGVLRKIDIVNGIVDPVVLVKRAAIDHLAFDRERELVAVSSGGDVSIYATGDLSLRMALPPVAGAVTSLAFSKDATLLATGGIDEGIRVFRVADGEQLAGPTGHPTGVSAVAASRDAKVVASGTMNGTLVLWNGDGFAQLASLDATAGDIRTVAFSPDAARLAVVGRDGSVSFCDPSTGSLTGRVAGTGAASQDVRFAQDGGIATVLYADGMLRRIDPATSEVVSATRIPIPGFPSCLAHGKDGTLAVGASSIRVFDAAGEAICEITDCRAPVLRIEFGTDGTTLYAVLADGTLRAYDVAPDEAGKRGRPIYSVRTGASRAVALALSPDGTIVATANNAESQVRLWRASDGAPLAELAGHEKNVHSLAFLDADRLLSGSDDATVIVWQIPRS
jgi:WD40 repeat protein